MNPNPEIRAALDEVLQASAGWKHSTTGLRCFYPMQGSLADGRLMLVGRALYGWSTIPFKAPEMESEAKRSEIIEDTFRQSSPEQGCPISRFLDACQKGRLNGAKGYNIKSSSFWSVGREVVQAFSALEEVEKWPNHLYWTNLCKLSLEKVGNPPWSLRKLIREASVKLLAAEIEALQPRRILFLTGAWWASHFLEDNPSFARQDEGVFLHARVYQTGFWKMKSQKEAALVVADHPERKKRSEIVADIMEAFERLGAGRGSLGA